jgi:glycosyltransferase involved in cell wall biosynthesis
MGGMQKHSYYLCKYLARNKIQVDLYHYNQSSLDVTKLDVFSEEEKKYIRSFIVEFPKSDRLPGHYLRASYDYSKRIFNLLKDRIAEYDFIYTKGFAGWFLIEQKKRGLVKCSPVGVKFHGYEMFQKAPDLKTRIQQELFLKGPVKKISNDADVVFSYGGKITEIIKGLGVPSQRIVELPSGVETSTLADVIKSTESTIRFLYLGRYERRKGIEELNSALATLTEKKFEFHFIGPIPKEKQLRSDKFIYHGEKRDKAELYSLIRNCDVLVCPSWSEGMPNVILEAMASGLAVVATDAGATRLLVSEKTGWLLHTPAPEIIKKAIENIISFPADQIDVKKRNALELIRTHYTWENLVPELIRQIKEFTISAKTVKAT